MDKNARRTITCAMALAAIFIPATCWAQAYTITTAAGGANPYYLSGTGDGGPATSAGLGSPCQDVAIDAAGNLYVAAGSLIRKVSPTGVISTFAGGGSNLGDGVRATAAQLSPLAIAVDPASNLYIADSVFGISRVRKVDTKGIITTVAGGADCCALGDGGPATGAYLAVPYGLAVDAAGNIFIAQASGGDVNYIRKVSTNGTITTVAGGGPCCTLGEGGPATAVRLARPTGVAMDTAGNLYIAEASGNRVRRVSSSGTISTIAGSGAGSSSGDGGPAGQAGVNSPWHVAVDSAGSVYITQISDARVRMVTSGGTITTIAGTGAHGFSGDGGPATSALLDRPAGIALGRNGVVYFADATYATARVRMLTPGQGSGVVPAIQPGGVVSASAFGQFSTVAPGSWIEIYGTNLATTTRTWTGADFSGLNAPVTLDGTKVTIGGQLAFISYISPTQVNAQVPSNVAVGPSELTVTTPGGTSAPYGLTVNASQPGLLAPTSFNLNGRLYAAALFPDGATFVLPPGAIPGLPSRRVKPGETISFYGVGFGPVSPAIPAGQVVQQTNTLVLPLQIWFGGVQATLTYSGLAPSAVGLYQLNVIVPNVASSDAVPLTIILDGVLGKQTLYVTVQ